MHAGTIVLTVDRPPATNGPVAGRRLRDRSFLISLACALCVHALIILGMLISNSSARTLGTPDGANDAIAVEIVDGATLKDSMEPPTPETPPPGAQPQQTAAIQPQPQPPQPPQETQPPPEPPTPEPQAEPTPPAEAAAPPPTPEATPPAESPPTPNPADALSAQDMPALADAPTADEQKQPPPQEAPKQEPPKEAAKETQKAEQKKQLQKQQQAKQQQQPPKKRTQTSSLDLSVPYDGAATDSDSGGSSAVQRPPGITRSGENDEFALNVIRALKKTMPRDRARGRVTVRIVLNENGSRADVKVIQSGGNPDLDFNVAFAARGTSYPFPPKNSTLVDRTFTVTYIYR
jgi:periplasmic protein TonB